MTNSQANGEPRPGPVAGMMLAERYRLEEQVAAGGMGEVWRATDQLLERRVAVKLLRESLAEDSVVAERFRREALLAASLSHPNMAGVFDYVEAESRPGIVMEFVDGETLAAKLAREGRLDVSESVRICSALLGVLQSAHDGGIVHRDVKPGNVMLTEKGGVKVTDFGIARSVGHQTLTDAGMVIGTAHYLAPEQVSGAPASPASDLYAVGAILYEALTGAKPFEAETPLAIAMRRLTDDPVPPRELRGDLPEAVEQVLMRALERQPEDRYASADGMRRALEAALAAAQPPTAPVSVDPAPTMVLQGSEVQAATTVSRRRSLPAPVPASPDPGRTQRSYRRAAVIAALIAVVAGTIAVLLLRAGGSPGTVAIPSVVGRPLGEATRILEAERLNWQVKRAQSDRPRDEVLDQDPRPRPGLRVEEGSVVVLTLSSGEPPRPQDVKVPSLRGLNQEEAESRLRTADLKVGRVIFEETEDVDRGEVIRSRPGEGSTVQPGSEVDIVVATEPRRGKGKGNDD